MKNLKIIIGITAYNEGKNIKDLLQSILMQMQEGYVIEKIILINDGSTDNTEKVASGIKSDKIQMFNENIRLGQTERINQLLKFARQGIDAVVFLDADIILITPVELKRLVMPFHDKSIGMTNGLLLPKNRSSFIEKAIISTLIVYEKYIKSTKSGNNIYGVKGAMMGISKKLAESTKIPGDVFANDAFLYLACIEMGLKFMRIDKARAWYTIPSTIADQIKQNSRFNGSEVNLKKYFGESVKQEYLLNKKILYPIILKQLLQQPLHVLMIFFINFYSKLKAKYMSRNLGSKWEVAVTTKL